MKKDFKLQLKEQLIPFLEKMIAKENEHLLYLKRNEDIPVVKDFIIDCKRVMNHFEKRLSQYKEYVNK